VARRRARWIEYQDRVDPARLMFIDETWTRTNMAPLRGWARRGSHLIGKIPDGRWRTMTFLAALRHDRITAPWLLEGPIDGESFATYVEKALLPTLRPGDIVIIDNLGSHRGKIVRALIRSAGAKLFLLPKYSPDLNPIEQVSAKQASAAQGRRANGRNRLRRHRRASRRIHQQRMRQLLQKLRICTNLNARCF
jgi:transposase